MLLYMRLCGVHFDVPYFIVSILMCNLAYRDSASSQLTIVEIRGYRDREIESPDTVQKVPVFYVYCNIVELCLVDWERVRWSGSSREYGTDCWLPSRDLGTGRHSAHARTKG
jgi:hypothetical protein